jgi:hypothetical protein
MAVLWVLIAAPKPLGTVAVEAGTVPSCASVARDVGSRLPNGVTNVIAAPAARTVATGVIVQTRLVASGIWTPR